MVAIDCRGHGKSEKPHDPAKYGPQMAKDVIEMMDHLKIDKAHVHGYSMGGFIVTQLLATHPERFITASYGGSGVPEVDEEYSKQVPGRQARPRSAGGRSRQQAARHPDRDDEALAAVRQYPWKPAERAEIDLTKIKIPVLAINGEFDGPNAKTHRMQRELADFTRRRAAGQIAPDGDHGRLHPQLYIDSLVEFIDQNDK